jgi:hypothetical protein
MKQKFRIDESKGMDTDMKRNPEEKRPSGRQICVAIT